MRAALVGAALVHLQSDGDGGGTPSGAARNERDIGNASPNAVAYVGAMEYDDVIAAMFIPGPADAQSPATVDASPARRLRDAIEPIAMHSVWSRSTNERLAELGHNFMTGYVSSRAALLGDPTPGAVVSAFAVFEPTMLTGAYEAGRSLAGRDTLLAARDESTIASLSKVFADADVDSAAVGSVAAQMRAAVQAADGTGRPLFSGLRDLAWPDSAVGQLWRACELYREHRGDSHVAACVTAGLSAVEMNILTELYVGMPLASYSASRAWDEATLSAASKRLADQGLIHGEALTEAGIAFRSDLEHATDRLQQPIVDALGDDLGSVVDATSTWSQLCIDAQAFPPDVFKRAAG